MGADVDHIEIDYGRPYEEIRDEAWQPMFQALRAMLHRNLADVQNLDFLGDDRDQVPESLAGGVEAGCGLTVGEIERMYRVRTDVFDTIQDVFEEYDLLVSPTLAVGAVPSGVVGPSEIDGREIDAFSDWILTWPINLTGHPAASIPAGVTDDGHPVGMQLVGRRYADDTVLAAGATFEGRRPW